MGHELRLCSFDNPNSAVLTVGVLALSPTRTVCLANKKENVFTLDVLPSASKKNAMNVVPKR